MDEIKVDARLNKNVFLAILDEARKAGLKVVGHVPDLISIEDAAAAGMKCSEHFFGFEKVIVTLLGGQAQRTFAGMGSEADYLLRLSEVDPGEMEAVYKRLRASGLRFKTRRRGLQARGDLKKPSSPRNSTPPLSWEWQTAASQGFLRRNRLDAGGVDLPGIIAALAAFLMPPLLAAGKGQALAALWPAGGPWHGP